MIALQSLAATGRPQDSMLKPGIKPVSGLACDYETYERLEAVLEELIDSIPAQYRNRDQTFRIAVNTSAGALNLADNASKNGIRILIRPADEADKIFKHWINNRFLVPVPPEHGLAAPTDKAWYRFHDLQGPLVIQCMT